MSYDCFGSLDASLNHAEGALIFYSAIPVVGILSGLVRATVVGTTQTVIALAVVVFSAFAILFKYDKQALCKRAASHLVHGIGNIVGGCLEAIPFVGTLGFLIRFGCCCFRKGSSGSAHFLAYASLIQEEHANHDLESAQNPNIPSYEQHSRKCKLSLPLLAI